MSEWKEIETQADIDELLGEYGGFHDGCLTGASFESGAYVDDELNMGFGCADDYTLRVTFERQWRPKTLEMEFIGVRQVHLIGAEYNYCSLIYKADLTFVEGLLPGEPKRLIVWSQWKFDPSDMHNGFEEPADTYIVANRAKWRIPDD